VPYSNNTSDWTRGCKCDEEDGGNPQQHEQEVANTKLPAVLLFGAGKVPRGGKLDPLPHAPAKKMNEKRHERRGSERQKCRRQKIHGNFSRAANARRSGTANGESVSTVA
jgi:hypothetical protein